MHHLKSPMEMSPSGFQKAFFVGQASRLTWNVLHSLIGLGPYFDCIQRWTHGLGERTRPRVSWHAPSRDRSVEMQPQAGEPTLCRPRGAPDCARGRTRSPRHFSVQTIGKAQEQRDFGITLASLRLGESYDSESETPVLPSFSCKDNRVGPDAPHYSSEVVFPEGR